MNDFLNAIGFSNVKTRKQIDNILEDAINNFDLRYQHKEGDILKEERIRYYGLDYGIRVCGELDEEGEYRIENFFPFVAPEVISGEFNVDVIPRNDSVAYLGVCEDKRNGATILFRFVEGMDKNLGVPRYSERYNNARVCFTGLSNAGMIILPIAKSVMDNSIATVKRFKRNNLIEKAMAGNQEAIESLTLDDIDLLSSLQSRIQTEDVLSIVNTTFLPFGFENDQYLVIGEITECNSTRNKMTGDEVFVISVVANETPMTIAVNRNDLVGEPAVGRRFKGVVWLQGFLDI